MNKQGVPGTMSIMSNAPTPPSGFPRSLMSSYLGNPLGGVSVFDMIDIGLVCIWKIINIELKWYFL